jgi:hypothetical protein
MAWFLWFLITSGVLAKKEKLIDILKIYSRIYPKTTNPFFRIFEKKKSKKVKKIYIFFSKNPKFSNFLKIFFLFFATSYLLLKSKIPSFFCWFLRFWEFCKNYFFLRFMSFFLKNFSSNE